MRRLSTFQILAIALVIIAAVLSLLIGIISIFQDDGMTETERRNTDIPLTNTALYIIHIRTESGPIMGTSTQNALATAVAEATAIWITTSTAAATTPTPEPVNFATHQIPLTQTAVHADYVGTMAALDNMTTGTARALNMPTPEASPTPAN